MARKYKALNDSSLSAFKLPKDKKLVNLVDGEGLDIQILRTKRGGDEVITKTWRFTYARPLTAKRTTLTVGTYPATSLKEARERVQGYRGQLEAGIDPSAERKALKAQQAEVKENEKRVDSGLPLVGSYKDIAAKYRAHRDTPNMEDSWALKTGERWWELQERFVFPWIGHKHINDLTVPNIVQCYEKAVESSGAKTGAKVVDICKQAIEYVRGFEGFTDRNVAYDSRRKVKKQIIKSHPHLDESLQLGQLLAGLDDVTNTLTRTAALIQLYLWQRPGMVRCMRFDQLQLDHEDGPRWRIKACDMKVRTCNKHDKRFDHIVPLPAEVVRLIKSVMPINEGRSIYVFSTKKDAPLAANNFNIALRKAGFDCKTLTMHGLRGTGQTLCHDKLKVRKEVTEAHLAHVPPGLGKTYDNAKYLDERREMLEKWVAFVQAQGAKWQAKQKGLNVISPEPIAA